MQEAALEAVREFRAVLGRIRKAYEDMRPKSPDGTSGLVPMSAGFPRAWLRWRHLRHTARPRTVRTLSGRVKVARILARSGPLEGAGLHPWVWKAAEGLWRGGHHPEAVRAAASWVLDDELPRKLSVPKGTWGMGKAFSTGPPTEHSLRLRFRAFSARDPRLGQRPWWREALWHGV
jgi:hypothetical protein